MSGETKIDGKSHGSSHYKFSWRFFLGFLSVALFSFLSLMVLLSVYADSIPFSPFLKPSALDVFVARIGEYLPYVQLISGTLAFAGGGAAISLFKRERGRHRIFLAVGSVLFSLSLLVIFLPDIGASVYPSITPQTVIQNHNYFRNFTVFIPISMLITTFLGTILISLSTLKPLRTIISGVASLLMILSILDLWLGIRYSGVVGLYVPVLNNEIISNMFQNLLTFMNFMSLYSAEFLLIAFLLLSAALFPLFKKSP